MQTSNVFPIVFSIGEGGETSAKWVSPFFPNRVFRVMSASILSSILAVISNPAGRRFSVTVNRPLKTRAAFRGVDVRKQSVLTFGNYAYENSKPVREAVANGERDEPSQYPNGIVSVYARPNPNGAYIGMGKGGPNDLRLAAPLEGADNVIFLLDGRPVSRETVAPYVLASEVEERESVSEAKETLAPLGQRPFNTVKLENIVSIKG